MAWVATATTAAVAAAVVKAGKARRVLVVAQDAAKGATRAEPTGAVVAALGEALEGGEQRTRSFSVGRLVRLLPFVFGLEHGPRRGDLGSRQEASNSSHSGYCFLR